MFAGLALISLVDPAAVYGGASFTLFALMLAFWAAGAQRERQPAVAGAAIGLAAVVVMLATGGHGGVVRTGDAELSLFIWSLIAIGLPLGAFALRARAQRAAELQERADRLEREREQRTQAAVAAERARIARDLHDVIAHSVTVMTVQGGAARLLLDSDPARAREPLLVVEETGHQALADMRRLVGIVQDEPERTPALTPQPGLADLPALAEKLQRAGLPTELVVHGEPETLTPGVELAAYRVVQEALTNALKHAGPATARVTVELRAARATARDQRRRPRDIEPTRRRARPHRHARAGRPLRRPARGRPPSRRRLQRPRAPPARVGRRPRRPRQHGLHTRAAGEMIDAKTLPSGSGR